MPCAVVRRFCTYQSKRRLLAAAFGYALSHHPVWCVLCAVLRLCCAGHSERRPLAAELTGELCATQSTIIVSLIPNDGTLPKLSTLYFLLLEKLKDPSSTCCSQHSLVILRLLLYRNTSRSYTRALSARLNRVHAASSAATLALGSMWLVRMWALQLSHFSYMPTV